MINWRKKMERDENEISYASKRARLLAVTIFILMIVSFFLHLCAFGDLFFKNIDYQTDIKSMKIFFEKIVK
jgi:hypothetical protein